MRGLDPRFHLKMMDGRVKPGHDTEEAKGGTDG
jgi:hypothetical protein